MGLNTDRLIPVGKIGAPYGVNGAVKITSFTANPEDIFDYSPWYIHKKGEWIKVEREGEDVLGKYLVAKLPQCDTREETRHWTNCEIAVKRSQMPELPAGQYYWSDLEGLTVKTTTGLVLGVIEEMMETGANAVMIIQGEQRHLLPYLQEQVVKTVNLNENYMIVDWDTDF